MASIEEIIQREANPFDPVTFRSGNFWQEDESTSEIIAKSIHKDTISHVKQVLNLVAKDHRTRTLMLVGDLGSGKSYLLGRLKQTLNSQAFFVYVGPCPENDYIWRHTLRQTVDSLMHNPADQKESQLLLWLKSLSAFRDRGLMKTLLGERGLFINNFRNTYPAGIYQANEFFGALYCLTNPKLYFLACDWLRGENLDKDDLKILGVKNTINSEAAAQGILANFGRISAATQPIVLCFDQFEGRLLADGSADIQPIFTVNTAFHNENLKNFLIIISIVTHTWKQHRDRIQQSDIDRVEKHISLRPITLKQAEELWASRLYPLHLQANPKPQSPIYPLNKQSLEQRFPGGKTTPRRALSLGQSLFLKYKLGREALPEDPIASFKLLWLNELKKTQAKVTRIRQFSSLELISMLRRAFAALNIQEIQPKLLESKAYASYSFSYREPKKSENLGVVWTEEPNMSSFFWVIKACQNTLRQDQVKNLHLIRAEGLGKPSNRGYRLYDEIFKNSQNCHFTPDIKSVYYLATYDRLFNSARAGELVIADKNLSVTELESLTQKIGALQDCPLLQHLGIVSGNSNGNSNGKDFNGRGKLLSQGKDFLLSFITQHQLISRGIVARNVQSQFSEILDSEIQTLIQELRQENQIRILDDRPPIEEQIVCLIPQRAK